MEEPLQDSDSGEYVPSSLSINLNKLTWFSFSINLNKFTWSLSQTTLTRHPGGRHSNTSLKIKFKVT